MSVTHHIGFEIAEQKFRLVEVRSQNGEHAICTIDQYDTELNYGSHVLHEAPFNQQIAKCFMRDLTLCFKRQHIYASTVSLALTSHVPFISTLPLDSRLSGADEKEQLRWDCSLLSNIGAADDLEILTHTVRDNCDARNCLTVAIPSRTIDFLRTAFSLMTLRTVVLDADHFCAEHAVRTLAHQHSFALVGLHQHYFTISLYVKDRYVGYRTGRYSYTDQTVAPILRSLQDLLRTSNESGVHTMYAFGSASDDGFILSLQSLLPIRVEQFNPLATLSFTSPAIGERAFQFPPTTFSVALGAAIRTD